MNGKYFIYFCGYFEYQNLANKNISVYRFELKLKPAPHNYIQYILNENEPPKKNKKKK